MKTAYSSLWSIFYLHVQALARCRELQKTVSEHSSVVRAVQEERDVAVATLSRHGLVEEYQSVCQQGGVAQDHVTGPKDIEQLRQQNKELHAVIRQMRQEMEQLTSFSEQGDSEPHRQTGADGPALTVGYVRYMESEVVRLKTENHQLKERVQELSVMKKPPTPPLVFGRKRTPSPPPTGDKPSRRESQHRAHLVALSDTIATLQNKKSALELEALQLNTKVQQLEESLAAHQEKVTFQLLLSKSYLMIHTCPLAVQVHLLRAGQVPRSKVHQKLLQATRAIIALVREKEALGEERRWLREEVGRLRRLQASGERRRGSGTEVVQRSEESCEVRGPSPPEEEAVSLHSLKFTDSSDFEEVFQLVDPLSSTLQSEHQDMPNRPALLPNQDPPNQHPPKQHPPPQLMELRGSSVTAHQRVAGARKHQQTKTKKTEPHKPKLKIRNYNNKENVS